MSFLTDFLPALEALLKWSMITMVGLYFTFSNTVMKALKSMDNGADVMVEINKVILNPVFMTLFIGSGLGSAFLSLTGTGITAVSGGIFFIGTTMVTVIKNVPLNNKLLHAVDNKARQNTWTEYLNKWVFWNHVRTFSALISGFLLVV